MDVVVARCCAQDATVLREISLRESRHHTAGAVICDLEYDVVADPKLLPDPLALHELSIDVVGTHDDIGPEASHLEAALRIQLTEPVDRRRGEHMDRREV